MKLFAAIILVLSTSLIHAQNDSFTKHEFEKFVLQSFDDIFSAAKLETIQDYYADEFLILEDGVVWNKDSVVRAISNRLKAARKISRTNVITAVAFERDGNSAWGSYHNEATVSVDGGPDRKIKWLESAVLVKQQNGWRIKLLHSTRIR